MKNSSIIKQLLSLAKGVTALALVFCFTALPLMASSHREAPLISMDPAADNTDVYAFRSYETGREGYVTLLANYIPFQDPSGGPQFYRFDDSVQYEINVDNTGDGLPEFSYQFRFQTHIVNGNTILGHTAATQDGVVSSLLDTDYNMPQRYTVTLHNHTTGRDTILAQNVPMPPSNVGPKVTPNYETSLGANGVHTISADGTRVFVGQRDEGFFVDLGGAFDLLTFRSLRHDSQGVATLTPYNINTIGIEVPVGSLIRGGTAGSKVPPAATADNAVIGVWATANRMSTRVIGNLNSRTFSGNFVQVSRLGNPLVNEVVIPLKLKDAFNSIRPATDGTLSDVVTALQNPELQYLLQTRKAVTHVPGPNRTDIITIYATGIKSGTIAGFPGNFLNSDGIGHEMMRLNVGIAPTATGPGQVTASGGLSELGLLGGDIAGFPNGRRVFDDVVDISLRVVAGGTPFYPALNDPKTQPNSLLGDGVSTNEQDFLQRFPYLAPPNYGNQPRFTNYPAPGMTCRTATGLGSPTCLPTNGTQP